MTVTLRHETAVPIDLVSALVYLACAVGTGVLTRRRPAFGVAALLVLAPFDLTRYVGPTTVTTLKAALVGMIVALLAGRTDASALRTFPVRAMLVAFGATLAAIALSALRAEHGGEVVREAFKNGEYLVLFLVAALAYATDPDDRPFWRAVEIAVVLVALSALAEYVVGAHNGIFLGAHHSFPRIAGALEGPNQLAGYLDVAIPVLVARALVHRDRVLGAVIALAALVDLLTLSRAGVIAAVLGVAAVFVVLRPPGKLALRFAAGVVAVGLAAVVLAPRVGVPAGYFSLDQSPQVADHLANRAQLWHAALALWHRSPIVGNGAGNYELDLAEVGLNGVRTHANSLYLQSLAEGGIVGLLATVASFAVTIVLLARSGVRRPLVVGALGATVALAAHQIGDDLFFFPKVASAYWLVVGVAIAEIAARRLFEQRRAEANPPVRAAGW
jgi:O-antigen ligase